MAKSTLSQNSETKKWPQIVAALIATLGSFSLGCGIGWASPTLPNIDPELCDDECDITDVPEVLVPWIGSLYLLGGVIAGPLAFSILDRIGRKKTMMGLSLPMLLGYGMITASYYLNNITVLLIGRFLAGISGCAYALVAPMFISEMSEPSIRGGLATMMQLMASVGVLFVGILNINSAVHWNFISAIMIGIPVIMTISLLFVPDSPKYLVMKNQIEDARKALQWFRGTTKTVVDVELEQMVEAYQREKEIGSISLKQLLTERIYLQPFILASFIMFGQQFCGVNFILFNAETIFTQAGSSVDPTLAACYIALSQFLATFASALIVDKLGRRILLIGSDLFMAVSMAAMGTYSYMDENKGNSCENSTATILQSMETLNDPSFQWKDLLHLLLRIENECDDSEGGKFDPEMVADLGWLPITSLSLFCLYV